MVWQGWTGFLLSIAFYHLVSNLLADVGRPRNAALGSPSRRFSFAVQWECLLRTAGSVSISDLYAGGFWVVYFLVTVGTTTVSKWLLLRNQLQSPAYHTVVMDRFCMRSCKRYKVLTNAATIQKLPRPDSIRTGTSEMLIYWYHFTLEEMWKIIKQVSLRSIGIQTSEISCFEWCYCMEFNWHVMIISFNGYSADMDILNKNMALLGWPHIVVFCDRRYKHFGALTNEKFSSQLPFKKILFKDFLKLVITERAYYGSIA